MSVAAVTLSAAEVAAMLGWSTEHFYRSVTALKRHHGFPPPLPSSRRYSRAAVAAWIERGGPPAPAAGDGLAEDVAAAEAQLLARAAAMGAG